MHGAIFVVKRPGSLAHVRIVPRRDPRTRRKFQVWRHIVAWNRDGENR
jgi:hypothetical protein